MISTTMRIASIIKASRLLENSLFQHGPSNTPPCVCSTNAMGLRPYCPSSMPIGRCYDRPLAVSEAFLYRFSCPQHVLQLQNSSRNMAMWMLLLQKAQAVHHQMCLDPSSPCMGGPGSRQEFMGPSLCHYSTPQNAKKCQISDIFCRSTF